MTKKRKTEHQLYDHNAPSAIHRSIRVTPAGHIRQSSNHIDLPSASAPPPLFNLTQDVTSITDPFDERHIPVNPENPEDVSGVKVKATPAKRYENSVRQYGYAARGSKAQFTLPPRMYHSSHGSPNGTNISTIACSWRVAAMTIVNARTALSTHLQFAVTTVMVASLYVEIAVSGDIIGTLFIVLRYAMRL